MGRESRQSRRQKQRRQTTSQQQSTSRMPVIIGSGIIIAVIVALAVFALTQKGGSASPGSNNTTSSVSPGKTIDGLQCNSMEQATYHVHTHLDIYVNGKYHAIPPYIGYNLNHDCLYWMHTHQPPYGIIHLEAPHYLKPTLGNFFDVWNQPLSRSQVWNYSVKPGETMKVWVNNKPYTGNPRNITIVNHKSVTIEIGPPFVAPKLFPFASHGL